MSQPTAAEWIEASIYIMNTSMEIGARLYPFLAVLNLLRAIALVI